MKLFNKEKETNKKIKKSEEIIRKEKQKIKEEKQKIRQNKSNQNSKLTLKKILKKLFLIKEGSKSNTKEQIITMIYFEIIGAIICLLVLFALSGGKNYFKLYKELSKIIDTYDTITTDYYGTIDKKELVDNAVNSMISNINDTYTNYNTEEETQTFMDDVTGTYEGIGASVLTDTDGKIKVVEVFEKSPSKKAGLKKDDIILKVDDKDYTSKTSEDLANYIKENTKKQIKLTIKRNNTTKEIVINRKKIEVPTITGKVIEQDNKKIGYIKISMFTSVTTNQFKNKLKKLEKKNIDGLIIDVRDNSGGYLSTVTDISSLFLKKGQVIYQLSDKSGTTKIKDKTTEKRTYPIAVLINESSASASEILASAIKESYKGYIVGTNSYGKGTVQKTKHLSDGSMIKYTIQKWLTPNGNWINKKGVTPTNKVKLDTSQKEDNQLSETINIIVKDLNK
jgi:carboxyl-terminal processing protease